MSHELATYILFGGMFAVIFLILGVLLTDVITDGRFVTWLFRGKF